MAQRCNFPGRRRIRQQSAIARKEAQLKTYQIFLEAEIADIKAGKGVKHLHEESRDALISTISKTIADIGFSKAKLTAV
jgi:hypothetical protein